MLSRKGAGEKLKEKLSARELAFAGMGAALMAASAWISVPSLLPSMVPFTMQTFGVCLIGAVLGLRLGLRSVCGYILLGAVGVPVFSLFRGGLTVLAGPTGGYIIGFVFTVLAVGAVSDWVEGRFWPTVLSMAVGTVLCYAFGTAWFMVVYTKANGAVGLGTVLSWCVFPFILPDLVKLALALTIARRVQPMLSGVRKATA